MRANFEMKFSDFDFLELDSSTSSKIFDTVDSPNSFVVLILSTPDILMHPLMTSSPSDASRGALSPVRATVLSVDLPLVITPSIGIFSPGFTTIVLPMPTSSGLILMSFPSFSIFV